MKKIFIILPVLLLCLLQPIKSYAQTNTHVAIMMYGGTLMLPFFAFGAPIAGAAMLPKTVYDVNMKRYSHKKEVNNDIEQYNVCPLLKGLYINADEVNMYKGLAKIGYSNLHKADNFDDVEDNINDKQYLCIEPKTTRLYPNGCLDTLEKDSIEKLSGNWYLDKGFAYHQIEYVQLVNDKGDKAYSDVVTTIKNVYYEGKKIDISESVKKDSYFNLKYAVELNCKK